MYSMYNSIWRVGAIKKFWYHYVVLTKQHMFIIESFGSMAINKAIRAVCIMFN